MFHHYGGRSRRTFAALAVPAVAAAALLGAASAASAGTYTSGAWTLTAPSTDTYSAQVQQPVNADGSSVFSHKSSTIPVQFKVTDTSRFIFESLNSADLNYHASGPGENDYSALTYTPASNITLGQLSGLAANYGWMTGTDHGGSLRWSITLASGKNIFVYYGDEPNTTSDNLAYAGGQNILGAGDLRFDTSQIGGTFYDTLADAQVLAGSQTVSSVSLVLDGGWGGDQVMSLTSASVTDSVNGSSAFTFPSASMVATNAAPAWITLNKGGSSVGPVDESILTSTQGDTGGQFRQVDGKYIYNLPVNDLSGTGDYYVGITFTQGGSPVPSQVKFGLR